MFTRYFQIPKQQTNHHMAKINNSTPLSAVEIQNTKQETHVLFLPFRRAHWVFPEVNFGRSMVIYNNQNIKWLNPFHIWHYTQTYNTQNWSQWQNTKNKRNNKYQLIEQYQLGFTKSHYTIKTKWSLFFWIIMLLVWRIYQFYWRLIFDTKHP